MPRGKGQTRGNGRLRRPEIGRSEPIRNWGTLFGPPAEGGGAPGGRGRAAESESSNPIIRGVELGYRVMDDYVGQGRRAASLRNGAGGPVETLASGLPQLTERMFQYASDFASVWMEAMGVMMRSRDGAGEGRRAEGSNGASSAEPPREERVRNGKSSAESRASNVGEAARAGEALTVVVEVTSRRPVRAIMDLRPGPIEGSLVVSDLRSSDGRRPRLKGVSLEAAPDGKRLTIRLKVASSHPAGEYVGAVVDGAAVTRGTLTVTVDGAAN